MDQLLLYFSGNQLEVWGFIFGIAYVLLATRQSVWCWPAGIINVTMYIVVFWRSGLYGDSALQVFYLGMSFYGLYMWMQHQPGKNPSLTIRTTQSGQWIRLSLLTTAAALLFGYILQRFTDSQIPYQDGLTTSLGLFATWMTARKLIENWWVWVFTNLLCSGIYFYKGLYTTMVFYAILAILAVNGYYQWKKQLQQEKV